jgi:hypothetical protein
MSKRDHPVLETLGVMVLFLVLVAAAPGALATFAVERAFGAQLELGQRWTFALASSVLLALGFAVCSRTGWDGVSRYTMLSFATAAVLSVARFGFRAAWAAAFFAAYVP